MNSTHCHRFAAAFSRRDFLRRMNRHEMEIKKQFSIIRRFVQTVCMAVAALAQSGAAADSPGPARLSLAEAVPSVAKPPVFGKERIDNAVLIPKYKPDAEVKMEGMSPDWVKTLIMAQFRIETATPEGTFASATKVLDHYAEMGVNGLWINPVYARDPASKNVGLTAMATMARTRLIPI